MRSMPRSACVIQITPVRLTRTIANAVSVVRKMYLSIDPIVTADPPLPQIPALWAPDKGSQPFPEAGAPPWLLPVVPKLGYLNIIPLIRQQNGSAMAPVKDA